MAFHFDPADQLNETAEINVTPFIDVMLVLLIIFMVAAPLSTVDAPVDLPVSTAKPAPRANKPVIVSIKADLALLVGNDAVALDGLASALDVASGIKRDERVFLRADKGVSYGELTRVMNALRAAGYLKVALVGMEGSDERKAAAPVAGTMSKAMTGVAVSPFAVGRGRWMVHGVLMAGVHGLVLAAGLLVLPARDISAEDFGAAMAVEYAELPSETESETAEAAVETPPEDARIDMNRIEERLSSAAAADLPTANASPVEAPLDLQLAQQKTQKKQATEQSEETTEAMEAQKAAPPPSAASKEGSSNEASNLPMNWQRALVAHLGRHKRYPAAVRATRQQGEALVRFVMDREGNVLSRTLVRGSGYAALDKEAMEVFARAVPLPPFPQEARAQRATLLIPISFRLK